MVLYFIIVGVLCPKDVIPSSVCNLIIIFQDHLRVSRVVKRKLSYLLPMHVKSVVCKQSCYNEVHQRYEETKNKGLPSFKWQHGINLKKIIVMHVKLNVKQYMYMKHLYFNGYPIYVMIIREFLELLSHLASWPILTLVPQSEKQRLYQLC